MKTARWVVAGLIVGLGIGLFASAFGQGGSSVRFAPFVVDVHQAVPVEVQVPLLESGKKVTQTIPLTVTVGLQVQVEGPNLAKVQTKGVLSPTIRTKTSGGRLTDDLGKTYEFVKIDPGVKLDSWTAYESANGWFALSGEVINTDTGKHFSRVDFIAKFYKGAKLVKVEPFSEGGRFVEPNESLPFDHSVTVQPNDFDRYTVEVRIGDWN